MHRVGGMQDWLLSSEGRKWVPAPAAAEAATPGAGVAQLKIARPEECAEMAEQRADGGGNV